MSGEHRTGGTDAFYVRVQAAVADAPTPYRWQRRERGFDMIADVPTTGRHTTQVHTYRVDLDPGELTFVMTDIVRTETHGPGPVRARSVETGRSRYWVTGGSVDGAERQSFSSTAGHRLIRGVAGELGWREIKPTGQQAAKVFGIVGGVIALGTLIALAVVFWP
ncbi:hypothetical protein [Streptomyces kanamyceticus]|uniref:Uncharacterized protein n=1 Tax=Streptomyces kanamyceticus TaxID=1967 RepID=A0A5J6GNR7_STRKN|nr:hypothetical protein [Streptomyces kanamyceticus]QEU96042.1 hypothetical protein CP970_38510 [Streptomyces kanamyceticus]